MVSYKLLKRNPAQLSRQVEQAGNSIHDTRNGEPLVVGNSNCCYTNTALSSDNSPQLKLGASQFVPFSIESGP